MAGIYIHIPFCRKACHYCDFHFSTTLNLVDDLHRSLRKELMLRSNELKDEEIGSIYLGGGTPSVLSPTQIGQLLDDIHANFVVTEGAEVTIEVNPDDCDIRVMESWKKSGVNRLSIGIQSFHQKDLAWMNRSHNAAQAEKAVHDAASLGFKDITIDLIYGLPEASLSDWEYNVNKALSLPINHLSAYNLTVEQGTALHHFVKTGKTKNVDDELSAKALSYLQQQIDQNDWEQYEISNYCRSRAYAVHNTNYWRQVPYLGIGPSAHSYVDGKRRWNVRNNPKYIQSLENGAQFWEVEELTDIDRFNEHIMLGLRTKWGVNISEIATKFGVKLTRDGEYDRFVRAKLIEEIDGNVVLTRAGILLGDYIASCFFRTNDSN